MKYIILFIVLVLVSGILYWSSWRDSRVNDYWDRQFAVCQKVGYYEVGKGSGYCVPAGEVPYSSSSPY